VNRKYLAGRITKQGKNYSFIIFAPVETIVDVWTTAHCSIFELSERNNTRRRTRYEFARAYLAPILPRFVVEGQPARRYINGYLCHRLIVASLTDHATGNNSRTGTRGRAVTDMCQVLPLSTRLLNIILATLENLLHILRLNGLNYDL